MKQILIAGMVVAVGAAVAAQEREVPKDSARVTLQGCASDRTFIVGPRSEDQPGTLEVDPGRRFRLNGPKKILDEIKKRQSRTVEVTGLIRKNDVQGSQGIPVLGGRVRIGGAGVPRSPMGDPARDPAYNQVTIDVESWRELPGNCSSK
jgi:hypothetical protein